MEIYLLDCKIIMLYETRYTGICVLLVTVYKLQFHIKNCFTIGVSKHIVKSVKPR